MRTNLLIVTTILITLSIGVAVTPHAEAQRAKCADFAFQEEAQAFMQTRKANYLDRDNDGIACERLPRRGSKPKPSIPPAVRSPHTQTVPSNRQSQFIVMSVGDGDTLKVQDRQTQITVRLACVDAPERAQAPWGSIASERLKQLLPIGQVVQLRKVDRDRYGRTVAEVYVKEQSINLQMVQEGMAVIYPQYFQNCAATSAQYRQAEAIAKQQGSGVWNPNNPLPIMPWQFRSASLSLLG
ncbi:thermonuclease family protein [Leptolyngbyaceae cyanobacterium UHCC 1019]